MPIMMWEVFEIENLTDYKIHFAKWNGSHEPLDVFIRISQRGISDSKR